MCHCAVYRIRQDIFCLTSYQLSATRWGSFPLLRKASVSVDKTLSTQAPLMFSTDPHLHTAILYHHVGYLRSKIIFSHKAFNVSMKEMTYFPDVPRHASVALFNTSPRIVTWSQKIKIYEGLYCSPHHHPHQQSPVWSVWGVIHWLNKSHTILHTDSHSSSFDAHLSALWIFFLHNDGSIEAALHRILRSSLFLCLFEAVLPVYITFRRAERLVIAAS